LKLAEKIASLRRRNGWSQEELAEKLNVSRQAVSKWESAQSVPDLERILQLSSLFGVTTDYLLKEETEDVKQTGEIPHCITVTAKAASDYLKLRKKAAIRIALATFICVLAPITLIVGSASAELGLWPITVEYAGSIGLVVLAVLAAAAVALFMYTAFQSRPYDFLENEPFELEYGVSEMIKDRQKKYSSAYAFTNISAATICIMSPIPLFLSLSAMDEMTMIFSLVITMMLAGLGAALFIIAGVRWAAMQKLLKEGEYSPQKSGGIIKFIEDIYWILVVAFYLGWSFLTNNWHITWVVWPVAGVLSGIISSVSNYIDYKIRK